MNGLTTFFQRKGLRKDILKADQVGKSTSIVRIFLMETRLDSNSTILDQSPSSHDREDLNTTA